ncbi:MAG: 7-cyano-7-deazaguanine synthase QueC [Deltaproteobacteria bacterium]|nr:7-cyano-7-deazaguanine synthase QueC [Deltaproteobacteria bacterium]
MEKSILILSGGLDSTVSSFIAKEKTEPILALTFDYGQRAARREIEASSKIAGKLGVPHRVMSLGWLAEITKSPLVNREQKIPQLKEQDLDNINRSRETARAVWVPNRNGVFLNIAAAFAEALDASLLVTGFNAEEGITFPDNSAPFGRAADDFFWFSTLNRTRVISFTQGMTKVEIADKGKRLGVDFAEIWFCYEGNEKPCRQCESCQRSLRAIRETTPLRETR